MPFPPKTHYQKNRDSFPATKLEAHQGKWVAFSADGRRLVASADDIKTLSAALEEAGVTSQEVVLERIEFDMDELFLGAAELL